MRMENIEARNTLREIAMFFESQMKDNPFVDKKQIRHDIDAINEGIKAIGERGREVPRGSLVELSGAFEKFREAYVDLVDAIYRTNESDYCVSEEMVDGYPFSGSFDELNIEDWCELQMNKITDHIKNDEKEI